MSSHKHTFSGASAQMAASMANHSHAINVSGPTENTHNVSVADIMKMRELAFDRWNWDTGDDEDRALFERLDKILEEIKSHADQFYSPYVPLTIEP